MTMLWIASSSLLRPKTSTSAPSEEESISISINCALEAWVDLHLRGNTAIDWEIGDEDGVNLVVTIGSRIEFDAILARFRVFDRDRAMERERELAIANWESIENGEELFGDR